MTQLSQAQHSTPSIHSSITRIPVTPGVFLDARDIGLRPSLSPDGKKVAFSIWERVANEQKRQGRIWLVNTAEAEHGLPEPHPLTHGPETANSPRWSPDGKHIAYIQITGEGEHERGQLFIMSSDGNDVREICTMPNGVGDIEWSPDGKYIAFLSLEGKEPKRDPIVVVPARHIRLWTVNVESDTPVPVTPTNLTIWEYAWSPDSRSFAVYYSEKPDDNGWYAGQVGLVSAHGGAVRQLTHLTQQASGLTWTPDGRAITYVSGDWSDRGNASGDIYQLAVDNNEAMGAMVAIGEPRNLTPGISISPVVTRWFPDGKRLLFNAYSGVTHQLAIREEDGTITLLEDDFVMGRGQLLTTPDLSAFVVLHGSPQEMYDIWYGTLPDENAEQQQGIAWRRLTQLNPIIEEAFALATSERIRYESADGWQIDAIFTHPSIRKGNNTEGPPPLIVNVHGGPSWAYSDDIGLFWTQTLASAGFAVLRANIRGSWGRGVEFADAVIGDMGGKDFQDILRGVDYLIERGMVDGDRVGICGWSYGGFMTAWAVSQTTRFKAAVMGAGIADWHSFHAQSSLSDWDARYLKADPLDNPDVYRKWSPITYANRIVTPTLILHGEKDRDVPVNQGYTFHRALYERGIPTELVVYPREFHGPRERDHMRDIDERTIRWFEQYM